MDADAIADHIPFFQGVPVTSRNNILSLGELKSFPTQAVVIDQEGWAMGVSFIVEGWVSVTTCVKNTPQTLDIFGQGSHLGTMAVFDDYPPLHQAIALAPTEIIAVPAQRFLQLLLKDPLLQNRLLQLTNQRVRHLYRRLKSANQSAQRRVMKTLVYLGENYGATTDRGIEMVAIPPQTLAEMVHCDTRLVTEVLELLAGHNLLEMAIEDNCYYLPYIKKLHHFSKQF